MRRAIASRAGGGHDDGRVDARFARSRAEPESVLRVVKDGWQHHGVGERVVIEGDPWNAKVAPPMVRPLRSAHGG
jgi:hypothetical protein